MASPENAAALAARLHAGQTDKAGEPYIGHLARVAAILTRRWPHATRDEIDAAWLHDSLEDTEATEASLLAAGISAETIRIVRAVTRPEGSDYLAWIAALADSGDASVLRVKLADNEDNRDPARVAALPGAAERVATRYRPAWLLLEAGLARWGAQQWPEHISFMGPSGRYEVEIRRHPNGELEDGELVVTQSGSVTFWPIFVADPDEAGHHTEAQGMTGDGTGWWFSLEIGPPAVIGYYGKGVLIRRDSAVEVV